MDGRNKSSLFHISWGVALGLIRKRCTCSGAAIFKWVTVGTISSALNGACRVVTTLSPFLSYRKVQILMEMWQEAALPFTERLENSCCSYCRCHFNSSGLYQRSSWKRGNLVLLIDIIAIRTTFLKWFSWNTKSSSFCIFSSFTLIIKTNKKNGLSKTRSTRVYCGQWKEIAQGFWE